MAILASVMLAVLLAQVGLAVIAILEAAMTKRKSQLT